MARKMNSAFGKIVKMKFAPWETLAAVIGKGRVTRGQAVKKLWTYFKKHKLQDKKNRRNVNADEKLRPLFGKAQITMFEVPKILKKHLKKA